MHRAPTLAVVIALVTSAVSACRHPAPELPPASVDEPAPPVAERPVDNGTLTVLDPALFAEAGGGCPKTIQLGLCDTGVAAVDAAGECLQEQAVACAASTESPEKLTFCLGQLPGLDSHEVAAVVDCAGTIDRDLGCDCARLINATLPADDGFTTLAECQQAARKTAIDYLRPYARLCDRFFRCADPNCPVKELRNTPIDQACFCSQDADGTFSFVCNFANGLRCCCTQEL